MQWLAFIAFSGFCYWMIFRDGAERLEGWLAAVSMDFFAAALSAGYLKAYTAISWFACVLVFLGSAR
ncbi:MAG: hypothetical protein KJO33_07505 [Gammaproteobacteria bacterium]|nr:hypothetical protein [Gammaproteobacteria bacterium]